MLCATVISAMLLTSLGTFAGCSNTQHTPTPAATTTTVSSSLNPSTAGASVTFGASVTATTGSGTPTGTVTFKDGDNSLGTAALSSGQAVYPTSALAVGTHDITAVYGGDADFVQSTSSSLMQIVNQAPPAPTSTTTAVSSSKNPSTYGDSVTFTATVTPTTGSGTPTGTVTFWDGTAILGTAPLTSGHASYLTSALSVGDHSIVAAYLGDSYYSRGNSTILTQIVNQAPG
jgi:Bacterial Ig-like domain (group 3)